MKKLIMSLAVASIATLSFANTSINNNTPTVITQTQDKVEVKPEELPEPVKAALAAAPYSEWKVEKAFIVPGENETKHFEINLSKGEETATVNLDKDGKVIQ